MDNEERVRVLYEAHIKRQAVKDKVVGAILMVIVGALTLYFAGGWDGLMNSKP